MNYLREYVEQGIRDHHQAAQEAWDKRNRLVGPRLHPSSVAGCPRAAILTAVSSFPEHPLYLEITHPFELYTQSVMMSGNVWEDVIADMILAQCRRDAWEEAKESMLENLVGCTRNKGMSNNEWAWEVDGLIRPGNNPDFPDGLIIELKDTAGYNFKAKNRLPYLRHAAQVATYQQLMELETGVCYPAHIYYNGRGTWAEFSVEATANVIRCEGLVNDKPRDVYFNYTLEAAMGFLELYWERQELPPQYGDPFEHDFTCVRGSDKKGYYPNCKWFNHCHMGRLPVDGPFSRGAFMPD